MQYDPFSVQEQMRLDFLYLIEKALIETKDDAKIVTLVMIAQKSANFILKEMIQMNPSSMKQCLTVISSIVSIESPMVENLISTLIAESKMLLTLGIMLIKGSAVVKENTLYLISNLTYNSRADATKIIESP